MIAAIGTSQQPIEIDHLPPAAAQMTEILLLNDSEHMSDSDLWGQLSQLIESHQQWTDEQCNQILKVWIEIRKCTPWQNKLFKFWKRWKQHHKDLQNELTQAGAMSWTQRCLFCQIWSANRPIMSPFCGVAEILLDHAYLALKAPPKVQEKKLTSEVIVITNDSKIEFFSEFGASRQLIWALENSGLSWSLCQPCVDNIEFDPQILKGVIFWTHRHRSNNFVYHAQKLEAVCLARNIPVINSLLSGWDVRHSTLLMKFQQAGIRCPKFQKFTDVDHIKIPYPLILRVDGIHRGQQMLRVNNVEEARALVRSARNDFLLSQEPNTLPPPNLAIEFIDTSDEQGQFHKCRAYIIGTQVILRHKMVNTNWLVNFATPELQKESRAVNKEFLYDSEPDLKLLVCAGKASGSDVTALDYSITPNGEYIFWEANRLFKMNGDKGYDLLVSISGVKANKRATRDRELGQSLLVLLRERFVH